MNRTQLLLIGISLLNAAQSFARFEAHEWGTFTSLVGSNGITQNGMTHEDETLPDFVHGFGETQALRSNTLLAQATPKPTPDPNGCSRVRKGCISEEFLSNNRITQKMETPVIYFYSDRQQKVEVNVRFPEGVVTETYPAPTSTFPRQDSPPIVANGNTTFNVDVLASQTGNIPAASVDNIYSHARNVGSNIVRSGSEEEKFIFYRGLGRFQPRISITSDKGSLRITSTKANLPQAIFLVHVNQKGQGQMLRLNNQATDQIVTTQTITALQNHSISQSSKILAGQNSREALAGSLVAAGLRHDEAAAMVATWENGYLKVPGLRLLYILPRGEVNDILPLQMNPAPEALERVFVGRIEVLLDTEEQNILNAIKVQGKNFNVASLGRFAEPILRRIQEVNLSKDRNQIYDTLIARAARANLNQVSTGTH